jgi:uncharacterized membrane protein
MNMSNNVLKKRFVFLLLACLIATLGVLRIADIKSRAILEHDEGITLLAVTGNQGSFTTLEDKQLLDAWQPASAWKQFVSMQSDVGLIQVQRDLNQYDIHPPLYFWGLSAFLQLYGTFDELAYSLNWLFVVMSVLLFYALLKLRFENKIALMLTAIFAFIPSLAGPFAVLRQYELMLLASTGCLLALSWYLMILKQRFLNQLLALALFTVFGLIGLMAHAQFLLVLAAFSAAIILLGLSGKQIIAVLSAVTTALSIFIFTNSGFLESVARMQKQSQDPSLFEFLHRLKYLVNSMDELVGLFPIPAFFVFVSFMGWALWQFCLSTIHKVEQDETTMLRKFWLSCSVVAIVLIFLQYLTMSSPRHAIGGRYFLPILPFYTLLIALWLEKYQLQGKSWAIALLLLGSSVNLLGNEMINRSKKEQSIAKALSGANAILISNPVRGILSPILPAIPTHAEVLVTRAVINDQTFSVLSRKLMKNDIVWLQSGYQVSAKQIKHQKNLLLQDVMLEEIVQGSGVFKVIRRIR